MTEILDLTFEEERTRGQFAPDYAFVEQWGTLKVGEESWPARLFLVAAPELQDYTVGDNFEYIVNYSTVPGKDWCVTNVYFASPLGHLTIESPQGVAEVEAACPAK